MSSLIAYFSRTGENYFGGCYRYIDKGNTEIVAGIIEKTTGSDLFRIEPFIPYSEKYSVCIKEAQDDLIKNARPEIIGCPKSIDKYDTIYLGYPIYWGTMPMACFTFLESFDFSGKVIMPFSTHEGSSLGHSVEDIRKTCPSAKVGKGIAIPGSEANNAGSRIASWIESQA